MHLRPSPALVIAVVALLLAAGGGAFAAVRSTGSAVNIVDGTTAANIAKVSGGGSLQVSGSVTATPTAASNYLHAAVTSLSSGSGCRTVMTPPTGKAMIVTEVEIDTFNNPSPGPGNAVTLFAGHCAAFVADVNPPGVEGTVLPFVPGLAVPAGSELSVFVGGNVQTEVYAFGYSVSASSVPSIADDGPAGPPKQ